MSLTKGDGSALVYKRDKTPDPMNSMPINSTHQRHRTSLTRTQRRKTSLTVSQAIQVELKDKPKKNIIIGLILMLMSGVLYAGLATFVKWASTLGYSAAEILVYRASVQIIVAGISYYIQIKRGNRGATKAKMSSFSRISGRAPHRQIVAIIGRGMFGACSTFTYFEGTTLINIGDCVTLKALAPVFTSFAGYFILKDKITPKHGISLFFALIACVLITQPPMIFNAS